MEESMLKGVRLFSITAMLTLLFAVGFSNAQDAKVVITGLGMVGGDIPTIDPGLAETSSAIEVINQIFLGVTNQDYTSASELGLAESYEVDGNTFTFKLMPDVAWVRYNAETDAVEQVTDAAGNPKFVTADDVAYGMLRSLNPETASPYSYVLVPYIVGAAEYNAGEGAAEDVQVKAVDATTLEITAPDSTPFAVQIYGLWMARPVPSWIIDEFGDVWTEPENIATNGPFAIKEWAHEESITIVKNPFWKGTDSVPVAKLDQVTFRFLDPAQAFAEYVAGNMDAVNIPLEEIDRVRADATLSVENQTGANPCTYYIGFDNTEAPTDNVHVRRALSLAIDRQSIVDNIAKSALGPAGFFTYPGLNAAPQQDEAPDAAMSFDAAAAQAELELALADLGITADELSTQLALVVNDSAGHIAIVTAVQQMWADTLGLNVAIEPRESTTYFASLSEDAPSTYRAGWCQDYGDANNFLYDVFFSGSSQNDTGFNSPEYDALVSEARLESDTAKRVELYTQAEQILVNEQAAIATIYFYGTNLLVKPGVERAPTVTGNESYFDWDKN
jgi:oligopeptide transport system substrate-binding protein